MITKTFILLGLTAFVVGDGHATSEQKVIVRSKIYGDLKHYGSNKPEHHEEYAWSYPSYEFYYKVEDPHTKDKKGQTENREGDEVKGEYWLYEPDGRKRTVEYSSDKKNGFNAIVKYSDPHKHDQHKEKDHKNDVKVVHEYKKEEEDHKKKEHDDKKDEEEEKDEKDYHFEILKVSHKDDGHKKDDHKNHKDTKDHDDKKKKDDKKGHDDDKHKYDDKRGHSSQIMPSLEQYRPFPYRQSRIRYDEPYPEQHYYRRNRKQY